MFKTLVNQATFAQSGGLPPEIFLIVPIFLIFYFLIIRPQQKKVKDHKVMLTGLKRGDKVLTAGGIVGKVTKVPPAPQDPKQVDPNQEVEVEIADGIKVMVLKDTISANITAAQNAQKEAAARKTKK